MKRTFLSTWLTCLVWVSGFAQPQGEGVSTNPYRIGTAEELLWFAQLVNGTLEGTAQNRGAYAELTADVDLASVCGKSVATWPGIGFDDDHAYTGTFDGKGYTISNLYVNNPTMKRNGLFGTVDGGAVKNVVLRQGTINGNRRCAALVGSALSATILGITVMDFTISGENSCGAVVGGADGSVLSDCHAEGIDLSAMTYVGGLCGYMSATSVSRCSANASVVSPKTNVGGLIGKMESKSSVSYCSAYGSVLCAQYAGGLVGYSDDSTVEYSLAQEDVTTTTASNSCTGGFAGYVKAGCLMGCYAIGGAVSTEASATNIGKFVGYSSADVLECCYSTDMMLVSGGVSRDYAIYKMEGFGSAIGLSNADFSSGKATYYLNGKKSGGDVWRQTIGTHLYPTLASDGGKVFVGGDVLCDGSTTETTVFSNEAEVTLHRVSHSASYDEMGTCSTCGQMNAQFLEADATGFYKISSLDDLLWFVQLVNSGSNKAASAILTCDIDLSSTTWTPIGTYARPSAIYSGTFDGGRYKITGLHIQSSAQYQGLFGYTNGAEIRNLTLSSSSVTGSTYTGLVVGYANATRLENVTTDAESSVSGTNCVGGIVGTIYSSSTVTKCRNEATVTCSSQKGGGIAGYVTGNGILVERCVNAGRVVAAKNSNSGGIAGCLGSTRQTGIVVTECLNLAALQAQGGIVGATQCLLMGVNGASVDQNLHVITNCANLGAIEGITGHLGGVIGSAEYANLSHCYSQAAVRKNSGTYSGAVAGSMTETVNMLNCYYDNTLYEGNIVGSSKGSVDALSTGKTTEQFASGEVCYLLHNGAAPIETVWRQTLGTDERPVFEGAIVYHNSERVPPYYNLLVGDVNADGSVNISDVTALVNIILEKASDTLGTADVNSDGSVNISDVTALVNIILEK